MEASDAGGSHTDLATNLVDTASFDSVARSTRAALRLHQLPHRNMDLEGLSEAGVSH